MSSPHKMFLDVDPDQAEGLALEDEVTLTIKGKICELARSTNYDELPVLGSKKKPKEKEVVRLGVDTSSIKINGKNAYEDMDSEEESD